MHQATCNVIDLNLQNDRQIQRIFSILNVKYIYISIYAAGFLWRDARKIISVFLLKHFTKIIYKKKKSKFLKRIHEPFSCKNKR